MIHTRVSLRLVLCAPLVAALLSPACAIAAQGYMDYFFREPVIDRPDISDDFKQVLASADRRDYQKADALMDGVLARAGAAKLEPAVEAQLLTDAGILKARTHQGDKAVPLLQRSVKIIEESVHRFSPLQFNPLMVEGMIQARARNYAVATELFRRAQHVLHLQDGVYTRKQLPVLEQLTSVDQARGMFLDADLQQRFDLRIAERAYGTNSEALVPTLEKVGKYFRSRGDDLPRFIADADLASNWLKNRVPGQFLTSGSADPFSDQTFASYSMAGNRSFGNQFRYFRASLFDQSAEMYERAIRILQDKYGPSDLRLVAPLLGLSNTRLLEGGSNTSAEQAMERATKIVETNPSTDVEDHINALVRLGDLYIITRNSQADTRYLDAWGLLDQHPDLTNLETQLFARPIRIYPVVRSFVLPSWPHEAPAGASLYTTLRFTVDTDGNPRDIEIVDGNVPQSNRSDLVRYFQKYVKYRPRIVDGKLVDTTNVEFRQSFFAEPPPPAKDSQAASQPAKKTGKDS